MCWPSGHSASWSLYLFLYPLHEQARAPLLPVLVPKNPHPKFPYWSYEFPLSSPPFPASDLGIRGGDRAQGSQGQILLNLHAHLKPSGHLWTYSQRSPQVLWSGKPGAEDGNLLSCKFLGKESSESRLKIWKNPQTHICGDVGVTVLVKFHM